MPNVLILGTRTVLLLQNGVDVLLNDEPERGTPICGMLWRSRSRGSLALLVLLLLWCTSKLRLLAFQTSQGQDGGVLTHLKYFGETHTFTPVQIMAMLSARLPVLDCVIGIPSYFTDMQKTRAYLDAATIAGLKPLTLMYDCAAATALGYGIYKLISPTLALLMMHSLILVIKEQYNIDVYSNVRALRAVCEKLSKVLTANAEAPLNI
ncbi:hypothetical protein PTKIN_Ptkin11bG0179400 [Pterospermum kingtungense]